MNGRFAYTKDEISNLQPTTNDKRINFTGKIEK